MLFHQMRPDKLVEKHLGWQKVKTYYFSGSLGGCLQMYRSYIHYRRSIIFSNTQHYAVYTCIMGSCMPSRRTLDDTNVSTTNRNVTTTPELVNQSAKPAYEQILPDYLQIFPEKWNMKDFLYYWAINLVISNLIFQVKPCFSSR